MIHVYPILFVYLRPSNEQPAALIVQHKGIQEAHDKEKT